MEQVSLGEWNEKSRKENGQDAADGMKQEVYSYRPIRKSDL